MVDNSKTPIINLTEKEKSIFATLMEVLATNSLNTPIRANGGWVRDKVMGLESDDIDISLEGMYGEDFAKLITDYMLKRGEKVTYKVIKATSEKSKHLETASVSVNGQVIDLVGMRSETYTGDSRIPTIEVGTPEQDSFRRDLTINSLYYNINNTTVEDWTGQGLHDIREKIIRTPLPPLQTFLDDPLRLLRTVRFTNRFEFTPVPELLDAAMNPAIREGLLEKASFERMGVELDKMLEGNNAHLSI